MYKICDVCMIVNETIYLNTESERKQPTMPFWTYKWLKKDNDEVMSKGVKAYEALLFANEEYEDSATDFEEFVDDRLVSLASHSLVEAVEKIKLEKATRNVVEYAVNHADIDSDERADHVNIHLPTDLIEQLTVNRGLGDHIADAVYTLVESAYSDRMDRIECKEELVKFLEDERRTPSHEVVRAIVEGDSREYLVEDAHRELNFVRADDWYESDSVTFDVLEERGEDITQGIENRSTALEIAVSNSDKDWDNEEVVEKAKDVFAVGESTAEKYTDDIDTTIVSAGLVHVDTKKLRREVVGLDHVGTEYDDDPTGYLGLDKGDPEDQDDQGDLKDGLMESKDAIEYLEYLRDKMSPEGIDDETRRNHIIDFLNHLGDAVDVIRGSESDKTYVEHHGVIDLNPNEK